MNDMASNKTAAAVPVRISQDDARGGSTPHIVRYVLGISLFLAVLAMSLAWIVPALFNQGS
jgi:hypothetical protein